MADTYKKLWSIQLKLAIFLEIMVKINRIFSDETRTAPSTQRHRNLIPILEFIDQNLDKDLSLKTLQKEFYISGSHLCQIFRQTTGFTLHEYIMYKRICRAKQCLINGESSYNAAVKCGFTDYSNFYRAFKKVTGYSPREYLKQISK